MYIRIHMYVVHVFELLTSTALKKICFPFLKLFSQHFGVFLEFLPLSHNLPKKVLDTFVTN